MWAAMLQLKSGVRGGARKAQAEVGEPRARPGLGEGLIGPHMAPTKISTGFLSGTFPRDPTYGPPRVRARPKAERGRPKADLLRLDALGTFRRPGHRPAEGRRPA